MGIIMMNSCRGVLSHPQLASHQEEQDEQPQKEWSLLTVWVCIRVHNPWIEVSHHIFTAYYDVQGAVS